MDNARVVNGEYVFEGDQLAIDGQLDISYESLCHHCYLEEKEKYLQRIKERGKVKVKEKSL